jgi:hypothetical protein
LVWRSSHIFQDAKFSLKREIIFGGASIERSKKIRQTENISFASNFHRMMLTKNYAASAQINLQNLSRNLQNGKFFVN